MKIEKLAHSSQLQQTRISNCKGDRHGERGSRLAAKSVMFNKSGSFRSYFLTFGIGAAVGAAVVLLYAPMTGRKMQRKVAHATEKVREVVEDSVDNVQNVLRKVADA